MLKGTKTLHWFMYGCNFFLRFVLPCQIFVDFISLVLNVITVSYNLQTLLIRYVIMFKSVLALHSQMHFHLCMVCQSFECD